MGEKYDEARLYDAVIIGGGPAGLTAALYLARARYRVLVVERDRFGGQITITASVVNYPGVLSASGSELTETMRRQAEAFGAEFMLAEVTGLDLAGDVKRVSTTRGEVSCFAVLLATGASPRRLGFAGEDEFRGRGAVGHASRTSFVVEAWPTAPRATASSSPAGRSAWWEAASRLPRRASFSQSTRVT